MVAIVIFLTLVWVQTGAPGPMSFDSLYHAKFSHLVSEGAMPSRSFPWLPHTAIGARYSDESVLAHRLMAPFVSRDVERGMLWFAVWQAALFFVGFHAVAIRLGCAAPGFLTASALAGSSFFLSRMLQGRPMTLALLLALIALGAVRHERRGILFLAAAALAQVHGSYLILLVLVGIQIMWSALTEGRRDLRTLGAAVGGVVLGLVLHPDFPHSLDFTLWHMRVVGGEEALTEWRSLDTYTLTWWNGGVLLVFVATVLAWLAHPAPLAADTRSWGVLFLFTLVLGWKSTRFLDFWIPLGLLTCGLAWRDLGLTAWLEGGRRALFAGMVGTLAVLAGGAYFVTEVRSGMQRYDPAPYREVWKSASALGLRPGEVVFNSNWGDFFPLWYLDDRIRFATGQNPGFLRAGNPGLARLHESIAAGEVDFPSVPMLERFGARVCLLSPRHSALRAKIERDPWMVLVGEEPRLGLRLYQIRPDLLDFLPGPGDAAPTWKVPLEIPGAWLRSSARAHRGYLSEGPTLQLRTVDPVTTLALRLPVPWTGTVGIRLDARAQPAGTSATVALEGGSFAGISGGDVLQATHHFTFRETGSAVMNITIRSPGGPATLELSSVVLAPAGR